MKDTLNTMKRREFLGRSTAFGLFAAVPFSIRGKFGLNRALDSVPNCMVEDKPAAPAASPLKPPAKDSIPVAFVISDGAVIIDFCGPWEVFENASITTSGSMRHDLFRLYTVGESTRPIRASGGMKIVPEYTFDTAPAPKVIVIPAQQGATDAMVDWIRKSSKNADLTMSVCTGAFVLAKTGLLSGKSATTHHGAYRELAMQYPDIHVQRGARYVEQGDVATAGGLSSGIDLALRVVERYFGREVAEKTAYQLEYQGQGWLNSDSNAIYAKASVSTDEHPLCPVCDMEVDKASAPKSDYKGKIYYFCMPSHKELFDASPEKFLNTSAT